jgi:hypothetical protein
MNSRERILAIILVGVIVLGGGGLFGYRFLYVPWSEKTRTLAELKKKAEEKEARVGEIRREQAKLNRWRAMSLPGDPDVSRREYEKYLNELMSRNGFGPGKYSVTPRPVDAKSSPTIGAKKEPIYTKLVYNVQAYATLANLVKMMEGFYHTPLLHQIKNFSAQRQLTTSNQTRTDELDVRMTVEAIIVTGADSRSWLLPNVDRRLLLADLAAGLRRGPTGLGLALWAVGPTGPTGPEMLAEPPRYYDAIASKNVFHGRTPVAPPKPDTPRETGNPPELLPTRFTYLTDITTNDRGRTESFLFDRSSNKRFRLRSAVGFNTFPFIKDPEGRTVVQGAVTLIEDRDVYFRAELYAEDLPRVRSASTAGFFRIDRKDREALLADKLIAAGEEGRVFRVGQEYWDKLRRQQVLALSEREKGLFRFEVERESDRPSTDPDLRIEVLRGKVLKTDGTDVLIRVEARYYGLHVGSSVEDSLRKALEESKVKELKLASGG